MFGSRDPPEAPHPRRTLLALTNTHDFSCRPHHDTPPAMSIAHPGRPIIHLGKPASEDHQKPQPLNASTLQRFNFPREDAAEHRTRLPLIKKPRALWARGLPRLNHCQENCQALLRDGRPNLHGIRSVDFQNCVQLFFRIGALARFTNRNCFGK